MFRAHVIIIWRSKFYYTASGIITPIGGRPVHRLREDCASSWLITKIILCPLHAVRQNAVRAGYVYLFVRNSYHRLTC